MEDEKTILKIKRGYLNDDFKFFHIRDNRNEEFEFHYHDFNKIIIFLSGKVNYIIEGKSYKLKPWDILFISKSETHKPIIDASEDYERIIIWVNSVFLERHNTEDTNLLSCFELAGREKFNLLRLGSDSIRDIKHVLNELEIACSSKEFGSNILKRALFIQVIVYLNRLFLEIEEYKNNVEVEYDENIEKILDYIKENLASDLSIETLSAVSYTNRFYLMHRFKEQTGYTIHNYILQKRLIHASSLIKKGRSITEACLESGFNDYSSFLRSFKNMFGVTPKKYYKIQLEIEKTVARKG